MKRRKKPKQTAAGLPPRKLVEELQETGDLIRRKRWSEARDRLEALDRKFPGHQPVLADLANTYLELGNLVGYMGACERLLRVDEGEPDVWQGLAGAYLSNHHPALALRTFQELLRRAPDDPRGRDWQRTATELQELMRELLAELHFEGPDALQLAALDETVQVALALGQYPRARRAIQELLQLQPRYAPALNNLTQVDAVEGRIEEAIATADRVLEFEPENIHALSNRTRCLCLCGRLDEARACSDRLVASRAPATDAWLKKAEALAYLGDDVRTLEVLAQAEREDEALSPLLLHFGAVASLRLGREGEARANWKRALRLDPGFEPARENLEDLRRPAAEREGPWAHSIAAWLSAAVIDDLRRHLAPAKARGEHGARQAARRFLQTHPAVATLVPLLLDRRDPQGRGLALGLVELAQTPELLAAAREYALGQRGPDQSRMKAGTLAAEAGMFPSGPVRMWMQGEWLEVLLLGLELHGEPSSRFDHDPKVLTFMGDAIQAMKARQPERAAKLLQQALEVEPDRPDLLNNLAAAYASMGERDRGERLTERIFELDPDYLFGRANLARIAVRRGDLEKAHGLLKPLVGLPRLHFTEFSSVAGAHVDLAIAEGKLDAAHAWLRMWEEAYPDDPNLEAYRLVIGGRRRRGPLRAEPRTRRRAATPDRLGFPWSPPG